MMKFKNLSIYGFASLLMLGAASCSSDGFDNDLNNPLEADQSFYVNISVNGTNTNTRAGALGDYGEGQNAYNPTGEPNFNAGEGTENDVNSIYLLFYDAAGKKLQFNYPVNFLDAPGANASQNAIYKSTVQVDVNKGENLPAYVIAFINPVQTSFPDAEFGTLAQVEQLTRTDLFNTTKQDFAMSNSVYYGKDEVTGLNNVRIMATPITSLQLFNSENKAKEALNADPATSTVDIYVERYAGKVNFSVDDEGIDAVEAENIDGETVELVFVPEYWTINANEERSYVTKNYFESNGSAIDFSAPASYETVNDILKGWYWNSSTFFRSYWGQSPSYYAATYPRVSDDILDQYTPAEWKANYKNNSNYKGGYELKYYSYEEIKANVGTAVNSLAKAVPAAGASTTIYTRENTVAGSALKDANDDPLASPLAAIASVVMVGHYTVSVNGGQASPIGDDEIFYIQGNDENYKYYTEEQMLKRFITNGILLATQETLEGESTFIPVTADNVDQYEGYFVIDHPTKNVRGNVVMDSRYVTLQITPEVVGSTALSKGPLYAKVGDQYVQVTAENIDNINTLLLSSAGTAYGFKGGKAYFNIPIQHLGYYRGEPNANPNADKAPNSSEFNWNAVQSGDFGVVRNHLYTIKVNTIAGLGYGIPRTDDPIVPPTDPDKYYIGARIVVLNWAVVPTQSVDL